MKRTLFITLAFSSTLLAASFEQNLAKNIAQAAHVEAKILSHVSLAGLNNLKLALIETADGHLFPVYASENGESFIGFMPVMKLSNEDTAQVDKIMGELERLQSKRESEAKVKISKLLNKIPKERTLLIKSPNKDVKKTVIIVSDPECPYCRRALGNIEERLKEANLRMIFAPVHGDDAYIKSQLIMNEAKKLNPDDTKERVAVIRKYFGEVKLSKADRNVDFSAIKANAEHIFKSGLIGGVPFIFEAE